MSSRFYSLDSWPTFLFDRCELSNFHLMVACIHTWLKEQHNGIKLTTCWLRPTSHKELWKLWVSSVRISVKLASEIKAEVASQMTITNELGCPPMLCIFASSVLFIHTNETGHRLFQVSPVCITNHGNSLHFMLQGAWQNFGLALGNHFRSLPDADWRIYK